MGIPRDYVEKVYAGLLGKCIGIRLGAPVEATVWTYERIRRTYGEIQGYLRDFRNFAADDDFNGPVFFIRALRDHGEDGPVRARDVGRAWLDYARDGKGFFWWGGYGRSTEHTAYANLAAGIEAPESGSARRNGIVAAEQIGGQIFVDTWGLVFPADPALAARHGGMAAGVSHDGNGVYGGMFVSAAVSAAFSEVDPRRIVEAALGVIPADCEYARVVRAVHSFHGEAPGDFRACREMLERDFGYDRYPGVCHIIPNAGVCILALLYGGGSLSRTVEVATMCGWDTDCNAGTAGAVIGVAGGLSGVEAKYRAPINDFHACIHRTAFAVSTDELRPAMMGVLLQTKGTEMRAVATDGHRLVRLVHTQSKPVSLKKDVVIPAKALLVLGKSMDEGTIVISVSDTHIKFSFGQSFLVSRLIDETYPNYEAVIPSDNDKRMTVKRDDIISSIRRVALYASATTRQIRFDVSASSLKVTAQDLDFGGEARETLPCTYTGEDLEIGFNSGYLIDILTHLESEQVNFRFSSPTRAGIVSPVGGDEKDDIIMLVMPVRLNT